MIEYVVAAIVVFMGLVMLWKARPALRKFVRITDALDTLPDFMVRTDKDMAKIKGAVFPNHGSAIPDGIARLERDMRTALTRLDNVEQWVQTESDDAERTHSELMVRLDRVDRVDRVEVRVNPDEQPPAGA